MTPRIPISTAALRQALAAPLLIAVAVQNLGNLLLHAVVARELGPASYGELGALLALLTFLTVPLMAVQAAASAASAGTARAAGDGRRLLPLLGWAAVATMLTAGFTPLVVSTFHLTSVAEALILPPFVGVSIVLAAVRGRLLGHQRVGVVAGTFLVSIGSRLLLTLTLLPALGLMGALLATLSGEILALAMGLTAVFRAPRQLGSPAAWLVGGDLGRAALALTGLFLFTTVDLFLARALLDPVAAGSYVAAATIGKTLLALPAAALSAAYPRLVRAGRGHGRGPELVRTSVVVVGAALVSGLVVVAIPGLVLSVMFGDSFTSARSLVIVLAIVAAVSSIVSVATYAHLAVRSRWALLPWMGAALEVGIIAINHDSALAIARGSAIALSLLVVASIVPLARTITSTPRAHVASEPQGSAVTVPA